MKPDYLKECMSDITSAIKRSVSIDDFNREFCSVCLNKECSRSGNNNMLMGVRAATWRDQLFLNVPRADEGSAMSLKVAGQWNPPVELATAPVQINRDPEPQSVESALFNETNDMPEIDNTVPPGIVSIPKVSDEPGVTSDGVPRETENVNAPNVKSAEEYQTKHVPPTALNTPFNKPSYLGTTKEPEVVIDSGGSFTFG